MDRFNDLRQMRGSTPDELAWLNARLDELTAKEALLLRGAMVREPPRSGPELINLIMSLHGNELCYPVRNETQLGDFLIKHEIRCPAELTACVDVYKLGRKYVAQHPGTFKCGAYVLFSSSHRPPAYSGINLNTLTDSDWSVKLKLASEQEPDGVWLKLPDYADVTGWPDEIRIALDALGVRRIEECTLLEAKCILPEVSGIAEQYDHIGDLIYDGQNLGFALDEQGQGMPHFMERFMAALQYEECHTLEGAVDISQNLDCYDFFTKDGLRDYAMQELRRQDFSYGESLLVDCVDLEAFATDLLKQRGFHLNKNENAFIARNNKPFIPVHDNPKLMDLVME